VSDEPNPTIDDIFHALAGWEVVEEKLLEWKKKSSNQSRLLDEDFLNRAMSHPETQFRELAAQAGHWSHVIMARAIVDRAAEVRYVAACSHSTPTVELSNAAGDEDVNVRRGVASNRVTPVVTLHHLATAPFSGVWAELVQNPSTAAESLDLVPTGARPELHRQVMTHPNASSSLCQQLACAYLDEPGAPLRIMGLHLMFRGPVKVASWGQGRTDDPPVSFDRPSDVLRWLAEGGDLSTVAEYAHSAPCPAWLRQFVLSRVPAQAVRNA